jgi:thiol-disulfide isomerase/thioredoxin
VTTKERTLTAMAVVLAATVAVLIWQGSRTPPPPQAVDRQGRPLSIDPRGERLVLIHFWASWCPPCRDELPAIVRFAARHRAEGVQLVSISQDRSWADVDRYLAVTGVSLPTYLDASRQVGFRFGTLKLPETYLMNRRGILVSKYEGAVDWDNASVDGEVMRIAHSVR